MIGSSIDQSIKLVNWYRSIDDQSKTTQKPFIDCYRLAQQPHCLSSTQDVRVGALLTIRCIIILQQLVLLLLAISLFAKVQLLLPEFFCEGTMRPISVFWSPYIDPWIKLWFVKNRIPVDGALTLMRKNILQLLRTKLCFLSVYSFSVHLQPIDTNLSIDWYW